MSYNGYFYSPYYQQQQQQSPSQTPAPYSQQPSSTSSQYQTNQLPSISQSHAQATPVSGPYETLAYSSAYDSYSRTETRSDQPQRAGGRNDSSSYTATSRADDGSGYGSSGYGPGMTRNDNPLPDNARRGHSSKDSYGTGANAYNTSYSRNDYQSQKPEARAATSSYQYPSTYASTDIAHAAPYTQTSHSSQPSRRQSVRSPLMYSNSYDATQSQASTQPEETARTYQLPSITDTASAPVQEYRQSGSGVYDQRDSQPLSRSANLPSYKASEPAPTPEPRTQTPQQIYRDDRQHPRNAPITIPDDASPLPTENRATQKPQAQPKKPRAQQSQTARSKGTAQPKTSSTHTSTVASGSQPPNRAATAHQQSPKDYASRPIGEVEEQPTTVDPSRVFNQYEYQRRKDAVEAESRAAKEAAERAKEDARKAKEDAKKAELEAAQKANDEAEQAQRKSREEEARKVHSRIEEAARKKRAKAEEEARQRQSAVASSASAPTAPQPQTQAPSQTIEKSASPTQAKDPSNADAIKALFGSMFGQMRELKAKDPSLFSEVWEDFKKSQPPIGQASSQKPSILQGTSQTAMSVNSPTLQSPSMLDHESLPNLSASLDSPAVDSTANQEGDLNDRGRFPAQRRRRRTKAEIAAARAGSSDSSRVELARNDAVAGLTKLQQAKASENGGPSINSAEKTQAESSVALAGPSKAPGSGVQSESTAAGQAVAAPEAQSHAKDTRAPTVVAPSITGKAGPAASDAVDVAMQEAMRAFHYPNSGSATPFRPYTGPYSYPTRTPETPSVKSTTSTTDASLQARMQTIQAHNQATLAQQRWEPSQPSQPLQPPHSNPAHPAYLTPFDSRSHSAYGPHPPRNDIPGGNNQDRTQGAHAQPAAKTTVWPEKSRAAIAVAARDALMAEPKNVGKSITAQNLIDILEKEPSYIELCDTLENQMGFVLDKRQFAHSLLRAVPPTKAVPTATNSTALQKQVTPQQQAAPMTSVANDYGLRVVDPPSGSKRESISKGKQKQTQLSSPLTTQPTDPALSTEPQPTTKAAMARKRTFNDLVDLTADSDEEERLKRVKLVQLSDGQGPTDGSSREASRVRSVLSDQRSHPLLAGPAPKEKEGFDMSNLKNFTLSAAREALRTAEIAQPIDKRKARPVPVYNVKTLARDVLITAGKHETEAPLNFHLFGLRDIYKQVHSNTDLSTLRWDIMDPGGPTPGTGLEDLENGDEGGVSDGLGEELDEGLGAGLGEKGKAKARQVDDTVDVNGEVTEDEAQVFEAVPKRMVPSRGRGRGRGRGRPRGRGSRGGNLDRASLATHEKTAPENISLTLATRAPPPRGTFHQSSIRGKLDSSPRSKHFVTPRSKDRPTMPPLSGSTNRIDQLFRSSSTPRVVDLSSIDAGAATPLSWQTSDMTASGLTVQVPSTSTPGSTGKRRGRPPGSGGKKFQTPEGSAPKRRGRLPGSTNKPSSLRKSHVPPEDGVRVFVEPSKASDTGAVKTYLDPNDDDDGGVNEEGHERASSKRPKRWTEQSPPQPSSPVYAVYACGWEGCAAELHNLETLRKHVFKLHAGKSEVCRWRGCAGWEEEGFASAETLKSHVEKGHLGPLAWKLGDGPREAGTSDDGESETSVREIARL